MNLEKRKEEKEEKITYKISCPYASSKSKCSINIPLTTRIHRKAMILI